ncbi:chromatin modification-related protein EAF1 B-like isoform X3 [Syzygium oleosum]|uniref:chromatin modification-related protein EAF1 B-like isoform X3 n=1 Tax=Syzygium oleosum TaxID=219896 RepID=UPI0024B92F6F|nr:chromatin modification-related protein EAF1 B-like isoform X3 [Syzygium oleosum]
MHGCSGESTLLVNAEVDSSMGGVADCGVGTSIKASPHQAAIEKAQTELGLEYDYREERRRELEFLEKGGNPLDFKYSTATAASVQSTSLTDQHLEQVATSEARGSFALAASPHGDSLESSDRPRLLCGSNCVDNQLDSNGEGHLVEGEKNSMRGGRRNKFAPSKQSSQFDGSQNAKDSEESAIFRPYARRNRSRPNRDGARSSSADMFHGHGCHGLSLAMRVGFRDPKSSVSEIMNHKEESLLMITRPKCSSAKGNKRIQSDIGVDGEKDLESTSVHAESDHPGGNLDVAVKISRDNRSTRSVKVDLTKNAVDMDSGVSDIRARENSAFADTDLPSAVVAKVEDETSSGVVSSFADEHSDRRNHVNECQNKAAAFGVTGLDSESSCTRTSTGADVHNDCDVYNSSKTACITVNAGMLPSEPEASEKLISEEIVKEPNDSKSTEYDALSKDENKSDAHAHVANGAICKGEEMHERSGPEKEVQNSPGGRGMVQIGHVASAIERDRSKSFDGNPIIQEKIPLGRPQGIDVLACEQKSSSSERDHAVLLDPKICCLDNLNLVDKAREDRVVEEAQIIEARRKRIAELSFGAIKLENRRRSHWYYVLEEMAWLANDFAQERVWKMTAAAQLCHQIASASQLRFEEQYRQKKLKKLAFNFAKAVMQFWHVADMLAYGDDASFDMKSDHCLEDGPRKRDDNDLHHDKSRKIQKMQVLCSAKFPSLAVQGYAMRFLKENRLHVPAFKAEALTDTEEETDMEISQLSHDNHLTGDSIFYTISFGAMETYRKSVESCVTQCENTESNMQEEVNSSLPETISVYGYQATPHNENERETCMYNLSGTFKGSKLSKPFQKNQKRFKSYTSGSYEMAADLPYGENRMGTQQSFFMGKRAANLDVGPVPPKRMRTTPRQRVLSPLNGGAGLRGYTKSDASSGDTNSLQDDQSTLHSGSQVQKIMEAESVGGLEKQLPYDSADASIKSKKKKKQKLLSSPYEQDWQLDSTVHIEQRDQLKKRLENHYFDSNRASAKKPKMIKQSPDNTFDNITSVTGSIPSPVASQMSNMSTPNKLVNSTNGHDRSTKVKGFKMSTVQPGSGSLWSLVEDQALIVLVHDMGPNWELVSDAINNTLQFKCLFRKPKECKERHKCLMDKNAGDGADSGEDSGSSHSYPFTLPGIPKGSARQLFQHLQGPMVEQALNEHFEKIIRISQKQHYQRITNDSHNQKQIPVHHSHFVALSQVCPNNLNGVFLTPFDLCETTAPPVYQGSQASNLASSNQWAVPPMLATYGENKSGEISSLHGSSSMVLGPNSLSCTDALTASCRFNFPRTLSTPVDQQNTTQHYNQMTSPVNMQQPNLSVSGPLSVTDCDVRMKPGGNGVVVNSGMDGSMPMSRLEIHGMTSSSVLSTSSMMGMPSPVNMHPRPDSAQGNSTLQPREALHSVRPDHISEQQTQRLVPGFQKQVTQGNIQGVPPLNGLGCAFSNQATPTQMYPGHSQQQYQSSSRQPHLPNSPYYRPNIQGQNQATDLPQQTYAIRIAKERQLQQQHLQQPQQQLSGSNNAVTSHVQPQPQSPIPSLQNSSLQQSQSPSQSMPMSPQTPSSPMAPIFSPQHPQNYPLQPHALGLNHQNNTISCSTNQTGRQRQRQLQQQQPQQYSRPPPKRQQQKQAMKGIGRGNNLVNQNLSSDPSHLNGLSMAPGSRGVEKGDQVLQFAEGQGFRNPGSTVNNPVRPPKSQIPSNPNHPQLQQTLLSGPTSPVSKQIKQIPSKSDSSSAEHVSSIPNKAITSPLTASNHLQALHIHQQPTQKLVNPVRPPYAVFQQSHPMTSKPSIKSQTNQAQLDWRPVNNSTSQENTAATAAQASVDSANAAPGKKSQPLYASRLSAPPPRVGFVGRPLTANMAGNKSIPYVGQSTERCREPGSLSSHGHSIDCLGTQLGQKQSQPMMPPLMPRPSPKQQYQLQEQFLKSEEQQEALQKPLPKLPPQLQRQHLQAGQGN